MKLDGKTIGAFLKGGIRQSRATLIYGADEGQVRDYAKQIITATLGQQPDPMNLTELTAKQLADDPALLADALSSFSLMGGERLVWLRDPETETAEALLPLLLEANPTAYVLITLGELKADSKWRKIFEKEKQLAILPCYRDEGANLQRLLADKLRERGIRADADALNLLGSILGNDRAITLQEVEKIDLYLGEDRHLTLDAARDLTGDNRELGISDVCFAVTSGKATQLPSLLHFLYEDGTAPIALFRVLHSHFQRILGYHLQMQETGLSAEQLLEKNRVHFREKPKLSEALRRWPESKIFRAMEALFEGEHTLKTSPVNAEIFCSNLLHRLAHSAAGGR